MRRAPLVVAALPLVLLTACGLATDPFSIPSPAHAEELAVVVAEDPTDVEAAILLAVSRVSENRFVDARELLLRTHDAVPEDPTVLLLLGLAEQELGMPRSAFDRYEAYLAVYPTGPAGELARLRKDALAAENFRRQAAALIASPQARVESSVVLFPVSMAANGAFGSGEAAALTELIATDLALGRLKVADVGLVNALLDELGRSGIDRSNLSAAAIVRELVGASHAVLVTIRSGEIGELTWDVIILSEGGEGTTRLQPLTLNSQPRHTLDLEKRAAFEIIATVRSSIPTAVVASLNARTVGRVDALGPFGRGVEAEYRDDYATAREEFGEAFRVDPSFGLAE